LSRRTLTIVVMLFLIIELQGQLVKNDYDEVIWVNG
jgi:hypothetical protein